MREILFRAKAINRDKGYHRTNYNNGDWVYGLITRLYDERFENLPAEMTDENGVSGIEIDHNTICQYTGLKDKNGRKIWEGDIVKKHFYTDYDAFANSEEYTGVVKFRDCAWVIEFKRESYMCAVAIVDTISYSYDVEHFEVIGNIFDNKELLEN